MTEAMTQGKLFYQKQLDFLYAKDANAQIGCPIDFERLGELRANSRVRSNGFGGH